MPDRFHVHNRNLLLSLVAFAGSIAALFCFTGCECLHSTQFHICPDTASRNTDPRTQQKEVMPVLRATATQLGLEERNWPLRVNGAFCLFSEPTNGLSSGKNALWFGARSAGALIVVDAGLWNPGCKSERRHLFEHADRVLESNLLNAFAQRVVRFEKDDNRIQMEPDGRGNSQ